MGVKTYCDSSNKLKSKYTFHRKAGRSLIERRPIFSPDGESVLIIVEDVVRVYNIQTGDCVRTLETERSAKELVAIQFPDDENYNLIACSDTGCVTTWTWDNGAVLRETNLHLPGPDHKIVSFNLIDSNKCLVITRTPHRPVVTMALFSVKTGHLIHEFENSNTKFYEDMIRVATGWCEGDQFAAVTNGTAYLCIQNLNQPHIRSRIISLNRLRLMSVAAHQTESMVAVVDTLGRLIIYRGNLYRHDRVAREILHWHFLPVIAVCFSLQGSYIYTGGIEKVLVKWTVGSLANKAAQKEFIPRLPGMVRFISAHRAHVVITLSNNSVVIANTQMRVVSTILECGGLSPMARTLTMPLVYHQRLDGLLLGGRTGHLQLYSTATDKVLYNIDITEMNATPPEKNNLIPLETEITCAAVSGNGSWLVTSEYRNDGITYPEERLKFWAFDAKNLTTPFLQNTCVNLSHGGCKVVSLALNPLGHFCVSAGADQKLRVWKRERTVQKRVKTDVWNCLTACYYSSGISQFLSHGIFNTYKNSSVPPEQQPYLRLWECEGDIVRKLVNVHKQDKLLDEDVVDMGFKRDDENDMGGVAVSHDGSLIAAWFGCKLTLWDTHLCNLRTTLSHPALRPKGVHVQFGRHDAAHYLACTTDTCVAVWSLLSLTIKWMVQLNVTSLAADPFSNKMALVTENNDIYVFTPHSSTPIFSQRSLLRPETGVFKQCTFGTASGDDFRLYVMRNDSEIYCLEPEQSQDGKLEVISRRNVPTTNFGALVAEQTLSEVTPGGGTDLHHIDTNALRNTALNQFLSAAPHMLPPISLLCTSFLLHIAGHEEPKEEPDKDEDRMDVDVSSDEENDVTKPKQTTPKPTQLWTPNYEKVKEKRLQKVVNESLLDLHQTEYIFGV